MLTRSVDRVVLDFKNRRFGIIAFPIHSSEAINQSPLVNSRYLSSVHYFGDLCLRISGVDWRLVLDRVPPGSPESERGYVLESLSPITRIDGENRLDCWSFYRVWGDEGIVTFSTATLFTSIRIDVSIPDSVQFMFDKEEGRIAKARLKIEETQRFLFICRESDEFKHVPVLPHPY